MSNDKTTRPYVKLIRSTETQELMKYPPAFMLFCQIALRAKRTDDYNLHGLSVGQAMIGDYKSLGLTHRQYRTAIDKLKTGQFIATQTTNKGTIATIINTMVLDINEEVQGQAKRQSKDKQKTTINNIKEDILSIEERKLKFASTLEPFLEKYGRDMLTKFYRYWGEHNKSGTKFKQENEKTWDLGRRLETWSENDKVFNKQPKYSQLPNAIV